MKKIIPRLLFGPSIEARREAHLASSEPRSSDDLPTYGEIAGLAGMCSALMCGFVAILNAKEALSGTIEKAHSPQTALAITAAELCVGGIIGVRSSRRTRSY